MVFPATPVGLKVELDFSGDWSIPTDISTFVYGRDPVEITRGRTAEGGTIADPSALRLTLDNRDGRFSPRNPNGAYYGNIGRNTPIRVSVTGGNVRATSTRFTVGSFSTNDSVATSFLTDIDLRYDMRPTAWKFEPGTAKTLMTKDSGATNRTYFWELSNDGLLRLFWWPTGTGSALSATSTAALPYPFTGRKAVRVTLDVNNGAGGWTVTFYYSDTISGTWTQLGSPVTGVGVTTLFDSNAPTSVNCTFGSEVYAAQVRNGIGGSIVLNPDFTIVADGATVFSDSTGASWSGGSGASATSRRRRFYGEVSSWPQRWDLSGRDIYVQVEATGILRRLGQGASGLRSTLYRGVTALGSSLIAYWPTEDGETSVSIASAIDGAKPMKVGGTPDYGAFSDFAASAPIPTLNGSNWFGEVQPYTNTDQFQVRFLLAVPAAGTTNGAIICSIHTTGTAQSWDLVYGTGGTLTLNGYDADRTLQITTGAAAYAVNGKRLQVSIELVESGANVTYNLKTLQDDGTNGLFLTASLASFSVNRVARIYINPQGTLTDTAIGHVYAQSTTTNLFDLADQLQAFNGETAGTRIIRLCDEEGVTAHCLGDPADSEAMGPQPTAATLLELCRAAAEVDLGQLGETRFDFGIQYRTRVALLNSTPTLSLAYHSAHLSGLEPVDDDQATRNDITVSRDGGSSFRAQQLTGTLNVQDPVAGVGRYQDSPSVNAFSDPQLKHLAGWRLRQGTVDEARYPTIVVDLARTPFIASATLAGSVMDVDAGDGIAITGPPTWLPPDDISQLVRGMRETMSNFTHTVEFNGEPASGLSVGIYGDGTSAYSSRYSSDASTLASSATSSATSLSVATATGPLWTTVAGEFPFDIIVAGERMTVTAISGATSPQTFTVTRSVNGIVKAQSSGAALDLFTPSYYSL